MWLLFVAGDLFRFSSGFICSVLKIYIILCADAGLPVVTFIMQLFPIFSSCHVPASSKVGTSGPTFISNAPLPSESVPFSPDGYSHLRHMTPLPVGDFGIPLFSFPNYQPMVIPMEPEPNQPLTSPNSGKNQQNSSIQMVTVRMIMSGKVFLS